jgi:geranylgeranyl pyrophosphate synthase
MADMVLSGAAVTVGYNAAKADLRRTVQDFCGCSRHRGRQRCALGGGHCWRALVAVAAGKIFRDDAFKRVLPAACGVELSQAASLVLDDLPSMNDACVRRGKPCTHRAFPAWAADMRRSSW